MIHWIRKAYIPPIIDRVNTQSQTILKRPTKPPTHSRSHEFIPAPQIPNQGSLAPNHPDHKRRTGEMTSWSSPESPFLWRAGYFYPIKKSLGKKYPKKSSQTLILQVVCNLGHTSASKGPFRPASISLQEKPINPLGDKAMDDSPHLISGPICPKCSPLPNPPFA